LPMAMGKEDGEGCYSSLQHIYIQISQSVSIYIDTYIGFRFRETYREKDDEERSERC